jgi:hypothetical protein
MLLKKSRVVISLAIACVIGLTLPGLLPGTANAAGLDLEISGEGATSWHINQVKPGDYGIKTVTLHNAGDTKGYVAIWIDGIIDNEGDNPESETGDTTEPGELSRFLTLNISGNDVSPYTASSGFQLPVVLKNFPSSASDPLQLSEQPLAAGDTIQIQWEWSLPPQTRNDVQGDGVSFNIHYMLTQDSLVTKPSPLEYFAVPYNPTQGELQVPISSDNGNRSYYSPEDKLVIILSRDTWIISPINDEITNIVIDIFDPTPPLPENLIMLTSVYDVVVSTPQGPCSSPQIDRSAMILMYYDQNRLPEYYTSIYIASYDAVSGWSKLTDVSEINYETGRLMGFSTRLPAIAVVAEINVMSEHMDDILATAVSNPVQTPPEFEVSQLLEDSEPLQSLEDMESYKKLGVTSIIVIVGGILVVATLAYIVKKFWQSRHSTKY